MNRQTTTRLSLSLALIGSLACQYDQPPAIQYSRPAAGSVTNDKTTSIVVRFTEPIKPETLEVTFSSRKLDKEGRLLPWCQSGQTDGQDEPCLTPLVGPCTPQGDCPGATMTMSQDFTVLTFDPDGDLHVGECVLRISAGLADREGNATGIPYDIFFFVSPAGTVGPTTFQPGVFLTWMELDRPFPFPLEVYWHIRVEPDTGVVYGGGCDGDLIDPDGERVYDHEYWKPAPYLDERGFKFVFSGLVQDIQIEGEEGNAYFLETSPFYIYCAQPEVEVVDGWIAITIRYDEELGQVAEGRINATEAYILGTPEPSDATGVIFGYRLVGDEIGTDKAWEVCADTETFTSRPGS